jgi:hypothetical protein
MAANQELTDRTPAFFAAASTPLRRPSKRVAAYGGAAVA